MPVWFLSKASQRLADIAAKTGFYRNVHDGRDVGPLLKDWAAVVAAADSCLSDLQRKTKSGEPLESDSPQGV